MDQHTQERILTLPLSQLHPFKNHPFQVREDAWMEEMKESIRAQGVLMPGIVRVQSDGDYEIISGHRRHRASMLAGRTAMPVIVRDLDDAAAAIMMVDSNLHREHILPSERAFAYKIKLEAMQKQSEQSMKEASPQQSIWKRSDQRLAEQMGESRSQIRRYIRLTELHPKLLHFVDSGELPLGPAVELSFLTQQEQRHVLSAIEYAQRMPTTAQAKTIRKLSNMHQASPEFMEKILSSDNDPTTKRVTLTQEDLSEYFPKSYTPRQIKEEIKGLLELRHRQFQQQDHTR